MGLYSGGALLSEGYLRLRFAGSLFSRGLILGGGGGGGLLPEFYGNINNKYLNKNKNNTTRKKC